MSSAVSVGLDDDCAVQPFPQPLDPRLQMGLVLFGDVVLGVLLEVAFLAGDLDPRRHRQPARPFQLPISLAQGLETLLGDRLAADRGLGLRHRLFVTFLGR